MSRCTGNTPASKDMGFHRHASGNKGTRSIRRFLLPQSERVRIANLQLKPTTPTRLDEANHAPQIGYCGWRA